jgi:hypothetical protein
VSRVHALKQTLMSTKSIASGDPESSATGKYFASLIERLRIADAIKPKIKTFSSGTAALAAIGSNTPQGYRKLLCDRPDMAAAVNDEELVA